MGNAVELATASDGTGVKLKNKMQNKIPAMFSANSLAYWLGSSTTHIVDVPCRASVESRVWSLEFRAYSL